MATVHVDRIADQVLTVEGPYTADGVTGAVGLVAELVRRLNRATLRPSDSGLDDPRDLDTVVQDLAITTERMQQLLAQVANHVGLVRDNPRAGVDQGGADDMATVVAWAMLHLGEATHGLIQAHAALKAVGRGTSRLLLA